MVKVVTKNYDELIKAKGEKATPQEIEKAQKDDAALSAATADDEEDSRKLENRRGRKPSNVQMNEPKNTDYTAYIRKISKVREGAIGRNGQPGYFKTLTFQPTDERPEFILNVNTGFIEQNEDALKLDALVKLKVAHHIANVTEYWDADMELVTKHTSTSNNLADVVSAGFDAKYNQRMDLIENRMSNLLGKNKELAQLMAGVYAGNSTSGL